MKTTPNPSKIKERLQEEAEGPRQKSRSPGTAKDLNVLTQTLAGSGTPRTHQQAHFHRGGNHQTNGGRHAVWMNSDFLIPNARCFSHRQWRFPCKRREV